MKLPIIPQDKANHFIYGSVIYTLSYMLCHSVLYSFLILLAFAIGKEIYDKVSKKGNPELLDVVATLCGALPIIIVKLI